MKPIIRRTVDRLILLTVCGFLSACCGLCKKCPEDAECVIIPSNAATGIKSSAGSSAPNTDTEEPGDPDTSFPEGSHVTYPLFEGDYFSVTLPAKPGKATDTGEPTDRFDMPALPPLEVAYRMDCNGLDDLETFCKFIKESIDHSEGSYRMDCNGLDGPLDIYICNTIKRSIDRSEGSNRTGCNGRDGWDEVICKYILEGFRQFIVKGSRRLHVRQEVEKVVLNMGFSDRTVIADEFFKVGPHVMNSSGGDILKVAQINCENRRPNDLGSFCKLNKDQRIKLIERTTGMTADAYLNRKLTRYFYYQRPQYRKGPTDPNSSEKLCDPDSDSPDKCNVFIEHAVITATSRPGGNLTSVTGRIFPSYKVTNEPKLTGTEAVERAYKLLWKIPKISQYRGQPDAKPDLALVLLPYAHSRRFDLGRIRSLQWPGYKTPQLRYAYRTTLWGDFEYEPGRHLDAASWRAWVDAETGDILQLIPQFAFASAATGCVADAATICAKGKSWPIAPPAEPIETKFRINKSVNDQGQYCLELNGVFEQPRYNVSAATEPILKTLCSDDSNFVNDPNFAKGLECHPDADPSYCICKRDSKEPFAYLIMNVYSQVDRYQRVLDAALCEPQPSDIEACLNGHFKVAKNKGEIEDVSLRIGITNDVSSGRFVSPQGDYHLVLGEVGDAFFSSECPDVGVRPAAQDATVIIHEFSHLVTDRLLSSRPDTWCDEPACPVPHSLDLLHDLADGFSAIHTNTNWFGAWWSNVRPDDTDNSCETNDSPRELNHKLDHFPEHRDWINLRGAPEDVQFGHKEYADGQIAGAALWAVAESMERRIPTFGRAELQTALLNVLPGFRFFPDACSVYKQGDTCDYPDDCDLDVYRLLHVLLRDLLVNQPETQVSVSANKILAGFAKTGIFLVPPQCLGASTGGVSNGNNTHCPGGEKYGGDAVIEINDDWLNHHLEQVPKFRIWTGPQFRFDVDGDGDGDHASLVPESEQLCNKYYQVTIANNCGFAEEVSNLRFVKKTDYLPVNGNCQAEWSPDTEFWSKVAGASRSSGGSNLYYRVITSPTKDVAPETVLSSSEYPGVPMNVSDVYEPVNPPFAMLNDTGQPASDGVSSSCN